MIEDLDRIVEAIEALKPRVPYITNEYCQKVTKDGEVFVAGIPFEGEVLAVLHPSNLDEVLEVARRRGVRMYPLPRNVFEG